MVDLSWFDPNQAEPAATFEAIPEGRYTAVITESETRPTKSGNGTYLALAFQIIEGDYKGRVLWARLNLDNPSEVAQQVARSQLGAICRAVGVMSPRDSVELHNLPIVILVKCKRRSDTGELTNEIAGFAKREVPKNTPPWRR